MGLLILHADTPCSQTGDLLQQSNIETDQQRFRALQDTVRPSALATVLCCAALRRT